MLSTISQNTLNAAGNATYTFYKFVSWTRSSLMQPQGLFFQYANLILHVENAINANLTITSPPSKRARSLLSGRDTPANMTYAAITEVNDPLGGLQNPFVYPGVTCLDNSFSGINTLGTWTNRISSQMQTNPLIAYMGIASAACLSWPNLTAYNVERYTGPFPTKLKNKMLVLGGVNDPVAPRSENTLTEGYALPLRTRYI